MSINLHVELVRDRQPHRDSQTDDAKRVCRDLVIQNYQQWHSQKTMTSYYWRFMLICILYRLQNSHESDAELVSVVAPTVDSLVPIYSVRPSHQSYVRIKLSWKILWPKTAVISSDRGAILQDQFGYCQIWSSSWSVAYVATPNALRYQVASCTHASRKLWLTTSHRHHVVIIFILFPRTVRDWNIFPEAVVRASSPEVFRVWFMDNSICILVLYRQSV